MAYETHIDDFFLHPGCEKSPGCAKGPGCGAPPGWETGPGCEPPPCPAAPAGARRQLGLAPLAAPGAPPTKVMMAPVFLTPTGLHRFLVVKHKATGDWGLVSGGVKVSDTSLLSAGLREVFEETRGVLDLPVGEIGRMCTFEHACDLRAALGGGWYRVHVLTVPGRVLDTGGLRKTYHAAMAAAAIDAVPASFDETSDVQLVTEAEARALRVWPVCGRVIFSPEFSRALASASASDPIPISQSPPPETAKKM